MNYIDGFVAAVPNANKTLYTRTAKKAAAIFKDHGALSVIENWGDDVPAGKLTSFPLAVKCKPDETVVFSWIVWPSKSVRNKGMEKAMADPRFDFANNPMPFDGKRMIFGGFKTIVDE